jgi:hypothetical protein
MTERDAQGPCRSEPHADRQGVAPIPFSAVVAARNGWIGGRAVRLYVPFPRTLYPGLCAFCNALDSR